MNWWPWTWFLCHTDDVEYGTPCTWISPEDRRAGEITEVMRRSGDGSIASIKAREFKNDSTRYFPVDDHDGYELPELLPYTTMAPASGRFFLLIGYAEPPFIKDECWHPPDMRKEYKWEHDNGYGKQTMITGHICRICKMQNGFPTISNNWYKPDLRDNRYES